MRNFLIGFILLCFFLYSEENLKQKDVKKEETEIQISVEKINKLEKRISDLEKKINTIESQIKDLRNIIRDLQIYVRAPQQIIKPSEDEWQQVKIGMTKEEVSKILGTPNLTQPRQDKTEIWFYYELGRIFFGQNERVIKKELDKNLTPETIFK